MINSLYNNLYDIYDIKLKMLDISNVVCIHDSDDLISLFNKLNTQTGIETIKLSFQMVNILGISLCLDRITNVMNTRRRGAPRRRS